MYIQVWCGPRNKVRAFAGTFHLLKLHVLINDNNTSAYYNLAHLQRLTLKWQLEQLCRHEQLVHQSITILGC